MSKSDTYKIKCECGNIVTLKLYHSVNVSVNPRLRNEVQGRRINNYKCGRCDAQNELAHEFLYNDMDRNQWIFVIPEQLETKRDEVIQQKVTEWEDFKKNVKVDLGLKAPIVVFGYDELFRIINNT